MTTNRPLLAFIEQVRSQKADISDSDLATYEAEAIAQYQELDALRKEGDALKVELARLKFQNLVQRLFFWLEHIVKFFDHHP